MALTQQQIRERREAANKRKQNIVSADDAGRAVASRAQRQEDINRAKRERGGQTGLESQRANLASFRSRIGVKENKSTDPITGLDTSHADFSGVSVEDKARFDEMGKSIGERQTEHDREFNKRKAGYRGITSEDANTRAYDIGEDKVRAGELQIDYGTPTRDQKLAAYQNPLRASKEAGFRSGGALEGQREIGIYDDARGQDTRNKRYLGDVRRKRKIENLGGIPIEREAYAMYSPRETIERGENEDYDAYMGRKQKSRTRDQSDAINEIADAGYNQQYDSAKQQARTAKMRGEEAAPEYERTAAADEKLEHNIRYKEDLDELTEDVDEAKADWIRRKMLKIDGVGERERGILEKQLKAQADKEFKEKFDDGKEVLDKHRTRTYRAWETAQDKAEAKFKEDILKDSEKSKADIENEIWIDQYQGYLEEGASPVEARAKATRDLKIETESDPEVQDMASTIADDIEAGTMQADESFEKAMMKLGDATSAKKALELAGFTSTTISNLQENYQRDFLGYDEGTIAESKFSTTINDLFSGETTDVQILGQFVKDAKSNLSDEFVRKQLRSISTSLSADQDVKDEASALLEEMGGVTPEEKPLTTTQLEAKFLSGGFDSPEEEQQYLDKLGRLKGEDKDGKSVGFDDLELEEKESVLRAGKIAFGTKISDAEGEKILSVVADPGNKGKDIFDIVTGILGYKPAQNKEVGDELLNKLSQNLGRDEGLSVYPLDALSEQLSNGNVPGAINLVEKLITERAKKIEGEDFISETFVKRSIQNVNTIEKAVSDAESLGVDTLGTFEGTLSEWVGRFKGDEEAKVKAKIISATAEMRNQLLGSAVTETEERFLEPLLPRLSDRPAVFQEKLDTLKERGLIGLNSIRETYSLPGLNEAELLNKKERQKLYTGEVDTFTGEQEGRGLQSFKDLGIDRAEFSNLSTPDQKIFSDEFKTNPSSIKELKDLDFTPQEMVEFLRQESGQKKKTKTDARTSPEWHSKVGEVAKNIGVSDADLKTVIGIETAGTFNPSISNPNSSATGFIQFMDSTAKGLGTTTDEIAKMTPVEQMDVVEKYFKNKKVSNLGDLYLAIAAPAGLGKNDNHVIFKKGSEAWNINPGWRNNGGDITAGSIKRFAEKYRGKYS